MLETRLARPGGFGESLGSGTETPKEGQGDDKILWGLEPDGRFRLKSAYKLAAEELEPTEEEEWRKLWKWKGPNRIRHFLWLTLHERLLTNQERTRRKLTNDGSCEHLGCSSQETTEHLLRQCKKTEGLWRKLRHSVTVSDSSIPFKSWIIENPKDEEKGIDFGIILWHIWKQRNEEIPYGKKYCEQSLLHRILAYFNIVRSARQNNDMIKAGDITRKERRHLAWSPPDEGWMMINTDGSVIAEEGKAAGGGLLRDHLGRCHEAFSMNLGNCTVTRAELKAAETGLATAWRKGYRKIKLCMDSTTAISIIKNRDDDDHRYGTLALEFKRLLSLNWEVRIEHIYRENAIVLQIS